MYRPLMLLCCISFAVNPDCLASPTLLNLDPSWQEEVRALLEDDSWLQPSGPGHGYTEDYDYQPNKEDEDLRTRKRALSALSRWKPFTSAWGIRGMRSYARAPLVSAMSLGDAELDLLSADTRTVSRPKGQPLRYGRRRRR